jgi:uncharacterized protein
MPTTTGLSAGPLTDEEIQELDQFLLEAEGIEESMDISTLDGFLTAIMCGPKTILPSEWLRWVWDMESGKDAPEFKDQAQAQRILGLLMRHMNDIAQTLQQAPEHYQPLLMENPNDGDPIPIIDEWCSGVMKGVQLDADGWLPVVVGKPDWMSTITLYGTRKSQPALCQMSYAVIRSEIRTKSAATNLAPVGRAKSSNSVTEAPTGCTEPSSSNGTTGFREGQANRTMTASARKTAPHTWFPSYYEFATHNCERRAA